MGGIRPGEFDFAPWRMLGAVYLIKSGYTVSGGNITLEFRFYDVSQGKQLAAKRYTGSGKELRWMVHSFSDEVMLSVTGEKGPFTGKAGNPSL
jgi:TolB protein